MPEFWRGSLRATGIVVGFFPIAMSFGAIAAQTGVSQLAAMGMSVWVFAGASQFAAIEAVRQDLSAVSIVLTILIINLRHIPMSLAAQKNYRPFGKVKQFILSHGIVDETFALELSEETHSFAYYLGMHLCCWAAWVIGTGLGGWLGVQLPEQWLAFALPALFLCLLCNSLKQHWSREIMIALGVGIALVLLTQPWGATGVLLSILAVAAIASLLSQEKQSGGTKP
ncbi:AzlC family ABC transporter permease [Oculatella sp. LEGE 06141]|nr:AzlC family ABC transporter permease [Oculatella sp. LEGE 06141]